MCKYIVEKQKLKNCVTPPNVQKLSVSGVKDTAKK